ncbi:MAG: hypothetical protein ACYTGF_00370 [Planctomycetota bacterium]|jgi:hypothetical protein
MLNPVAGITVVDGMLSLVGVRPAGPAARKGIAPVEPARRPSYDDHLDLSPRARAAVQGQGSTQVHQPVDGIGRLIDVLA